MATTSTDLKSLMDFINQRYRFNEQTYPGIAEPINAHGGRFAVNHSVLHMNKSLGAIAAQVEAADHGGEMDEAALETATTKMLVNVLKLASELGLTAEDLAAAVPEVMKSK